MMPNISERKMREARGIDSRAKRIRENNRQTGLDRRHQSKRKK